MKINELRIGNWVQDSRDNNPCKVLGLDSERTLTYKNGEVLTGVVTCTQLDEFDGSRGRWLQYLVPIPLTEELMLKCGFVKADGFYYTYNCSFTLNYDKFDDGSYNATSHCNSIARGIKYLHQLQNLYFALTCEELKITR